MPNQLSRTARYAFLVHTLVISFCTAASSAAGNDGAELPHATTGATTGATARQREFQFTYAAVIEQLAPGEQVRCWVPLAQNTAHQLVTRTIKHPKQFQETVEPEFDNRMIYFIGTADAHGAIPIEIDYRVTRLEVTPDNWAPVNAAERERCLSGSLLMPTDETLLMQLVKLAAGKTDGRPERRLDQRRDLKTLAGREFARELYDMVGARMRYDKPPGQGWGRGDAVWACENGYGNCTDFHSLFIASARSRKLAAKFEIGFSIPEDVEHAFATGYHCWAFFEDAGRWAPVDISEGDKHPELRDYYFGNLSADRLTISVGRDLQLVPQQAAGPLNFMVGPYAERNGTPVTTIRWIETNASAR